MDILNPSLISIDGRVYCIPVHKNAVNNSTGSSNKFEQTSTSMPHVEWEDEPTCEVENTCSDIEKTTDGRCKLNLQVHDAFYKYIIGSRGDTLRKLENETKTKINIPKRGQTGDIVIIGGNSQAVLSAKNRIELLVSSKRWKEPFTHFVSIPLNSDNIKNSFNEFENCVLNDFSTDRGMEKSIFQRSSKLHLTICTLVLLNDNELERVKILLREVVRDVLGEGQLHLQLASLEYMNDDPAAVDVLYGKVRCLDDSNRLQEFADKVARKFIEEGLAQDQYDRVKLHCTLLNTIFRKSDEANTARRTFDASRILLKYQDFNFGNIPISEVHLSKKGSYSDDGYYQAAEKVLIDQ